MKPNMIRSMLVPVRFYTSVAYYVGPDEERTPMWQGYAMVMGRRVAEIFECHRVRSEKVLLSRLIEQVRDMNRNREGA